MTRSEKAARAGGRGGALAVLALVTAGLGAGCSNMVMEDEVTEFRNPDRDGETYAILAVVPSDPMGHDRQIAARAHERLEKEGVTAIYRISGANSDHRTAMSRFCPQGSSVPEYDGVAFITWDQIVFRDCRSHEIMYEISGGYAGIDRMVDYFIRFLREQPPPR